MVVEGRAAARAAAGSVVETAAAGSAKGEGVRAAATA
jgi:hypothetical protein